MLLLPISGDLTASYDVVQRIKQRLSQAPQGLRTAVTGSAAVIAGETATAIDIERASNIFLVTLGVDYRDTVHSGQSAGGRPCCSPGWCGDRLIHPGSQESGGRADGFDTAAVGAGSGERQQGEQGGEEQRATVAEQTVDAEQGKAQRQVHHGHQDRHHH